MTTQQTRLTSLTPWIIGAIAAVSVPKPTPHPASMRVERKDKR